MLSKKRAFTLIEVLVVVLIIGILAAVAVSQYKRAVLKSQYMQLVVTGHKVYEAQQIYYLTHGEYAQHFIDLDLQFDRIVGNGRELQIGGKYVCTFDNNALYCWLGSWATSPGFYMRFGTSVKMCLFYEGQDQADQFCNNISKDHVRRSWYGTLKYYDL